MRSLRWSHISLTPTDPRSMRFTYNDIMSWEIRKLTLRPSPSSGEGIAYLPVLVKHQDVVQSGGNNLSSSSDPVEYVVTAQVVDILRAPTAMAKMFAARPQAIVVRELETCRMLR